MPTPTWDGPTVSPQHVRQAAAICHDTLAPALEADWSIPAGPLTWTCRETIDHVSDALAYYCGQIATGATEPRPAIRNGDPAASIADLLDVVVTSGAILGAIATATPPDARAYHGMGRADAEGFLAMAYRDLRQAEIRIVGRNPDIAGQRDFCAAAERIAVHGRDHRRGRNAASSSQSAAIPAR